MKNIRRSDELKRRIFLTMHAATQVFIEQAKKQISKLENEIRVSHDLHLKGAKELKHSKLTITMEDAVIIEQAFRDIINYTRDIDQNFLKEIKKNQRLYQAIREAHTIFYELIDPLKIQPQGLVSKRIKKKSDTASLIDTYLAVLDKHIPGLKAACAPANKIKVSRFHLLYREPEKVINRENYPGLKVIAEKFVSEASKQLEKIEKELASALKTNKDKIIKNKKFKQEALTKCINAAKDIITECDLVIKFTTEHPNSDRPWDAREKSLQKIADSWWTTVNYQSALRELKHVGLISSFKSAPKPSKTDELIKIFRDNIEENCNLVRRFSIDKEYDTLNPNT